MITSNNNQFTCATCKFCAQINCHPDNIQVGNGNLSDKLGYACMLWLFDKEIKVLIFMENNLDFCECYTAKE